MNVSAVIKSVGGVRREKGYIRVAMAVQCMAQHATPRFTAQHTYTLQHNATTGITHIPSIVLAAIGG